MKMGSFVIFIFYKSKLMVDVKILTMGYYF